MIILVNYFNEVLSLVVSVTSDILGAALTDLNDEDRDN